MISQPLTDSQTARFHQDGFLIVRGLFDRQEADLLRQAAKADQAFKQHAYDLNDGEGGVSKLVLWNKAGEDLYGTVARSHRVVDRMEQLLGDEVYHYHSKMSIKEPLTGGAWSWHQDYGYWYQNGCLFPDLASVMIAVDPCTKENGCLQVLAGSHRMGRVEHGRYGDQTGADPERVENAMKVLPLVYGEMEPGDALFFHSNTLHRSDQNKSPHPRWTLICCYNTKHNNPYKPSHHPFYEPLVKVPDSRLKEIGLSLFPEGTEFWDPAYDKTVGAKPVETVAVGGTDSSGRCSIPS
jgi:ectoine hydroxylase